MLEAVVVLVKVVILLVVEVVALADRDWETKIEKTNLLL